MSANMSCDVVDSNYDLSITPSRKRKRESSKLVEPPNQEQPTSDTAVGCFTNAAFSSTPKKLLAKGVLAKREGRAGGGLKPFVTNPCLEVKSILDIVQDKDFNKDRQKQHDFKRSVPTENPYEVVRKPPKKKKKRTEFEEACFENPALNLELPEKLFNPFEVHRSPVRICSASNAKCFTNEALNLRSQDVPASRNPFEIPRCNNVSHTVNEAIGVENPALDAVVMPSQLQIGLPFTPTLGCRIDFKNLPLSELTPSRLLSEKLVFSPAMIVSNTKTPKRSLSSISEESMDIGKELDRYQLELENSINEAKLRKSTAGSGASLKEEALDVRTNFIQKLEEIAEQDEETVENLNDSQSTSIQSKGSREPPVEATKSNNDDIESVPATVTEETVPLLSASAEMAKAEPQSTLCKPDAVYASDDDEEESDDKNGFKAPAPFVRAYRRDNPPTLTFSKESLNSKKFDPKTDSSETPKKPKNVKSIIRNSIRKIIHPHASDVKKLSTEATASEKEASAPSSIISSIRHSFRRKPQKQQLLAQDEVDSDLHSAELSIIDSGERTMKLKSNLPQTEYIKIEELTHEKKASLRNSLRKSTREVRQQIMKTVFHKNQEEYAFKS